MFRKRMFKKALQYQVTVVVIITLLILAVMMLFLQRAGTSMELLVEDQQCKKSVKANALQLRLMGDELANNLGERQNIMCETDYVDVSEGKEKEVLANEMAICWNMFLEGEKEIFDTTDNNYCVVCSVLRFDEVKEINGFTKYLMNNSLPWNKSVRYYDYLTNSEYKGNFVENYENTRLANYDNIDTTKPLAVVFFMGKNAYPVSDFGYEGGKMKGMMQAGAVGVVGSLGLAAIGIATGGIGLVGGAAVLATGAIGGGWYGYMIGSSESAFWDAGILLHDYTKFDELN